MKSGGTYALSFRYANGDAGGSSRPLELQVNAAVANPSLSFPGTPEDWSDWFNSPGVAVNLSTGNNSIRLTDIGFGGANIDQISVTPLLFTIDAPSDLAATSLASSQNNLTWTDNSSNETGFVV